MFLVEFHYGEQWWCAWWRCLICLMVVVVVVVVLGSDVGRWLSVSVLFSCYSSSSEMHNPMTFCIVQSKRI